MRDHGYLHDLAEMPPSQCVFNETKCNQIRTVFESIRCFPGKVYSDNESLNDNLNLQNH